jgi:hypothetical protein
MAVITDMDVSSERSERQFFFWMALVIAASVIGGFGSWALRGNVSFPVPFYVHVHGLVFLTWVGLFVTQTTLIRRDQIGLHRMVGRFAVVWAAVMVVVGTITPIESVLRDRVPPFFTPTIFLALSFLEIAAFATLLASAIVLRKKSDWHRRLLLGATIALLSPAWGRILPMMALGSFGDIALFAVLVTYVGAGMTFDTRTRGSIHPAYYWVTLAIFIECLAVPVLAATPPVVALAKALAPH